MVDNVLYFSTENQVIVALDPETGTEIWKFDPKANGREQRGVSYWPGDRGTPPRILFGTAVFATMRMGRVGWENEVTAMLERGAIGTEEEIRKLVDYLAKNFAPE